MVEASEGLSNIMNIALAAGAIAPVSVDRINFKAPSL
jgi:hypothetical protein